MIENNELVTIDIIPKMINYEGKLILPTNNYLVNGNINIFLLKGHNCF